MDRSSESGGKAAVVDKYTPVFVRVMSISTCKGVTTQTNGNYTESRVRIKEL